MNNTTNKPLTQEQQKRLKSLIHQLEAKKSRYAERLQLLLKDGRRNWETLLTAKVAVENYLDTGPKQGDYYGFYFKVFRQLQELQEEIESGSERKLDVFEIEGEI